MKTNYFTEVKVPICPLNLNSSQDLNRFQIYKYVPYIWNFTGYRTFKYLQPSLTLLLTFVVVVVNWPGRSSECSHHGWQHVSDENERVLSREHKVQSHQCDHKVNRQPSNHGEDEHTHHLQINKQTNK